MGRALAFMQHLWSLAHALQAKSKRMESELGITGPQRLTLRIVGQSPGISPGELADTLRVDPSTLTGILRRLGERQVLVRSPDPRDGRRDQLTLTERGRSVDERRGSTVEAAVRRTLARVEPDELRAAERVIALLVEELSRDDAAGRPLPASRASSYKSERSPSEPQ